MADAANQALVSKTLESTGTELDGTIKKTQFVGELSTGNKTRRAAARVVARGALGGGGAGGGGGGAAPFRLRCAGTRAHIVRPL